MSAPGMTVAFLAVFSICSIASAEPIADFYAGKKIIVIVGSDAGGGYDAHARLMARHMGKFIPGNPALIVQNMPGAGSINAANNIYNVAPKDGTLIGLVQRNLLSANLTNQNGIRFDVRKFSWIGNLATEIPLFVSWHTSPVKTIDDLFKQEMVMGGAGPTSGAEVQARMFNALIGTKIKIVSGYTGQAQMQLAMERGEVDATGAWPWSDIKARFPSYIADHKINILIQGTIKRADDLPDVPTPFDFVKNDDDRKILELFYAQQVFARPIIAPPDIPADRLSALRSAFMAMSDDVEFHADADKQMIGSDVTSNESIENVIEIISSAPPDIIDRLAKMITPPS